MSLLYPVEACDVDIAIRCAASRSCTMAVAKFDVDDDVRSNTNLTNLDQMSRALKSGSDNSKSSEGPSARLLRADFIFLPRSIHRFRSFIKELHYYVRLHDTSFHHYDFSFEDIKDGPAWQPKQESFAVLAPTRTALEWSFGLARIAEI